MNVYLNKFMVYFEIHRLHREGFSMRKISEELVLDRRTVSKYLSMDERDFERHLERQSFRHKLLDPYADFVRERLEAFRDTSAAQMHDWLKERYADFPRVSPRTVFNFVSWVRERHNLPVVKVPRQYGMVEELHYGLQAQVDFGTYNMRSSLGGRAKVYFFTYLLSRSRYKFLYFSDRPFTAVLAVEAHEKAFAHTGGIPREIVYDQDRVFLVSENGGDLILTDTFRSYTREQSFSLYFCRKADPESKGKVENVVRYVKQNFLFNRSYHNLDTLNDEALAWLGRTANLLPHAVTGKEPYAELVLEQPFLSPYVPCLPASRPLSNYAVRKDNSVSFRGNFYSLPLGTYQGKGTAVSLLVQGGMLVISHPEKGLELCRHAIPSGKGQKIINTDHKRDKTGTVAEKIRQASQLFTDRAKALEWLERVAAEKPRYVRDQMALVVQAVEGRSIGQADRALDYCREKEIYSATDFGSILEIQDDTSKGDPKIKKINPLSGKTLEKANERPDTSNIDDYRALMD